ncbi:hypothetical protein EBR96_01905 [bacterium]|nr:hypothetical protein [bacterium]
MRIVGFVLVVLGILLFVRLRRTGVPVFLAALASIALVLLPFLLIPVIVVFLVLKLLNPASPGVTFRWGGNVSAQPESTPPPNRDTLKGSASFCPKCGENMGIGDSRCSKCGNVGFPG